MSAIRVVIVDDEPLAVERLRVLLSSIEDAIVVGTANGCKTGAEVIGRHRPDLVLLDIRMRDGTAFDLLSALAPDVTPLIAFSTAYSRYASQAFEVDALDYLLKPVEPSRLERVLAKARKSRDLLGVQGRAKELERIIEQLREADGEQAVAYEKELWVRRRGTEHIRVAISSIDRICALDDYVSIHADGQEHLLRASLDGVEAMLDPAVFARIHRSSIVRIASVAKVVGSRTGAKTAVLKDGTSLPIGRTYAKQLGWSATGSAFGR